MLEDLWNNESHAAALDLIAEDFEIGDCLMATERRGPLLMLDLVHLYKSCVADLSFEVRRQVADGLNVATFWSAGGRYSFGALGSARIGRSIRLRGSFVMEAEPGARSRIGENHWDAGTFAMSVGASADEISAALRKDADEIRLRVYPGRGSVPLVLFPTLSLPGWIGWKRLIRRFQASGPVVTFQLLGNRWALDGSRNTDGYSVRNETLAIEAALEGAGIRGPFDVVAHSAGGCIALDFACRQAERIRSLTLIEPALAWVLRAGDGLDAEMKDYILRRESLYHENISEEEYARFIQQSMPPGERVDPRTSPYWPDVSIYRENMKFRLALYRHRDRIEKLSALPFPVMLIQGKDSDPFHHRVMDVLESSIPRSRLVEMRGGHSPHLGDGLAPFIRHLSRFLSEVELEL